MITDPQKIQEPNASHDHKACVNRAIRKAEQLCRERGVQLTPIRHKTLELIWTSHQAVKAYDLLERIKPFNASAKPATVYRALDFLIEQKLIHRVESMNAFIGCNHMESQHDLLLLICERCHEIEERPAPEVMARLSQELATANFSSQRKSIEIHGVCGRCRHNDSTSKK
ncbi:MAG: Fur family transcriptional regulator [Gammaproteobacteria bacterium HGW-Gammaproteobacteria-3]|nr:MAG: Fur family transcriptional regulator [Gammaproteobacteria bacterium HGW-Gammaproteobacteria-3]